MNAILAQKRNSPIFDSSDVPKTLKSLEKFFSRINAFEELCVLQTKENFYKEHGPDASFQEGETRVHFIKLCRDNLINPLKRVLESEINFEGGGNYFTKHFGIKINFDEWLSNAIWDDTEFNMIKRELKKNSSLKNIVDLFYIRSYNFSLKSADEQALHGRPQKQDV